MMTYTTCNQPLASKGPKFDFKYFTSYDFVEQMDLVLIDYQPENKQYKENLSNAIQCPS